MAAKLLGAVLAVFLGVVGLDHRSSTQELPKCELARVRYESFEETFASKFLVESPKDLKTPFPTGEKVYSPQHTHWLIEAPADYMKPGPWTTRFYVGTGQSQTETLLTVIGHGNTISATWVNEKLLFGQVWWGRIYSTDFIFDIAQRKFIYREMAHYGELVQPCQ